VSDTRTAPIAYVFKNNPRAARRNFKLQELASGSSAALSDE
jgi:hypothetical protein